MSAHLAIVLSWLVAGLVSLAPAAAEASEFLVKDINPNGSSGPTWLQNVGGLLYFQAQDGTTGVEPWRSDGTEPGTILLRDIYLGAQGSYPSAFSDLNGAAYFSANDGALGHELWTSTGTSGSTALVKDLNPGPADSWPGVASSFTRVGSTLFFMAYSNAHGYELWKTDGSLAGSVLVRDINPGPDGSTPLGQIDFNGELVFRADDGLPASNHRELWRSDGTTNGTTILEDLNPTGEGYPADFVILNGALLFTANDGTHGDELWRSDGTPEGTDLLVDINPGAISSRPGQLRVLDGTLYFVANDGVHGAELWRSDGTAGGTEMVVDLNPMGSSPISSLAVAGDQLFFVRMAAAFNHELWGSDGTAGGTALLRAFTPSNYHPLVENLTDVEGTLYFSADDGVHGVELWKSDGTSAGTVLAADIWPGDLWSSSSPSYLTNIEGTLYFAANDGVHGNELCAIHGAAAGVAELGAGPISTLRLLPAAPNPFRGVTALRFDLDAPAAVRLQIFDVAGRLVREILPGDRLEAGRHAVDWDGRNASGRDLASGIYVYQVESAARREVGRVVLAR